jgi:hypothetical protein
MPAPTWTRVRHHHRKDADPSPADAKIRVIGRRKLVEVSCKSPRISSGREPLSIVEYAFLFDEVHVNRLREPLKEYRVEEDPMNGANTAAETNVMVVRDDKSGEVLYVILTIPV